MRAGRRLVDVRHDQVLVGWPSSWVVGVGQDRLAVDV